MKPVLRILIGFLVSTTCYLSLLYLNYVWDGAKDPFSLLPKSIGPLLGLGFGYVFWRELDGGIKSLKSFQIFGGLILGGIGLLSGILIPLLLHMGNQGPLIGIIMTGPIGLIFGLIFGRMYWKKHISLEQ